MKGRHWKTSNSLKITRVLTKYHHGYIFSPSQATKTQRYEIFVAQIYAKFTPKQRPEKKVIFKVYVTKIIFQIFQASSHVIDFALLSQVKEIQ